MEPWPLIGRETELERLAACGGRSEAVIILGAPGTGKSRLVQEHLAWTSAEPTLVTATVATRQVALGAFAPVLPGSLPDDPFGRLQTAGRWLCAQKSLLVVDDAHLLDAVSASLLHQVIEAGTLPVIATARTDARCDPSVSSLWTGSSATLLHLAVLDRATTFALTQKVLGGPVTPGSEHTIWDRTRGNPLALRELLTVTRDVGALVEVDGIWRMEGQLELPRSTAEVIATRIAVLDGAERDAFELIALGEPLPLAATEQLGISPACESLEDQGLVSVVARPDGPWLRPHHPLHGDAVRASLPEVRRIRHLRALAGVAPMVADSDPVRAAGWQLEAGVAADPALLHRAAVVARGMDPELALRLATAAVDQLPSSASLAVLAQATASLGDGRGALGQVRRAIAVAEGDTELADLASTLIRWIAPNEELREEALGCAQDLLLRVREGDAVDRIETELAASIAVLGRRDEIVRPVDRILQRSRSSPATALAAADHIMFGLFAGRTDGIDQRIDEVGSLAAELGVPLPLLVASRSTWYCLVGRIADAVEHDRRLLAATIEDGEADRRWMASTWLAVALELAGELSEALAVLADVEPRMQHAEPSALRHFHLAVTATVHAQLGSTAAARAALTGLPPSANGDVRVRAWASRAEVWVSALDGDLDAAQATVRGVGEDLEELGWLVYAALGHFDLVRLGRPLPAVEQLVRISSSADGSARLLHLMAQHAVAAAEGDGGALDRVAVQWVAAGSHLVAAEAAGTASIRHALAGRPDLSARSAVRAEAWVAHCPGASTPALFGWRSPLTTREREVAWLAAAGATSREIGRRLAISVRTVDNHLASVYGKVGISGREDLRDVLGMLGGDREPYPIAPGRRS